MRSFSSVRWSLTVLIAALAVLLALPAVANEKASEKASQTYGEGVELETTTSLAHVLADPAAFDGQTVRVEGYVQDVCPRKGCWMTLAAGPEGDALRIKVEDDVIVFPQEAKGRKAVAQGTVEVHEQSREEYVAWQSHLAEEKGESFDAESVGDGPFLSVQIRGTGAEIAAD
ncbi:MAG: DUF4920 domain-containing protein [Acidobacteriota bacterium]|nr:DUF4920 domain-containing protein [Acidobacteriota bacterium]